MPTIDDLGKLVKQKYPGAYDSLGDADLGKLIQQKYPGAYDHFTAVPPNAGPLVDPNNPAGARLPSVDQTIASGQREADATIQQLLTQPVPGMEKLGALPGLQTPQVPVGQVYNPVDAVTRFAKDAVETNITGDKTIDVNQPRLDFTKLAPTQEEARSESVGNPDEKANLILGAAAQGLGRGASGLTSFDSLATLGAAKLLGTASTLANSPYQRVGMRALNLMLSGYFGVEMAKGAKEGATQAYDSWQKGDYEGTAHALGYASVDALLAGMTGWHVAAETGRFGSDVKKGYQLAQERYARANAEEPLQNVPQQGLPGDVQQPATPESPKGPKNPATGKKPASARPKTPAAEQPFIDPSAVNSFVRGEDQSSEPTARTTPQAPAVTVPDQGTEAPSGTADTPRAQQTSAPSVPQVVAEGKHATERPDAETDDDPAARIRAARTALENGTEFDDKQLEGFRSAMQDADRQIGKHGDSAPDELYADTHEVNRLLKNPDQRGKGRYEVPDFDSPDAEGSKVVAEGKHGAEDAPEQDEDAQAEVLQYKGKKAEARIIVRQQEDGQWTAQSDFSHHSGNHLGRYGSSDTTFPTRDEAVANAASGLIDEHEREILNRRDSVTTDTQRKEAQKIIDWARGLTAATPSTAPTTRTTDPQVGATFQSGSGTHTVTEVWRTATTKEADGQLNITVKAPDGSSYTYVGRETRAILKHFDGGKKNPLIEARDKKRAEAEKPARKVTPQVPNDSDGTKYVLPTFVTDQYRKPNAGKPAPKVEDGRVLKHWTTPESAAALQGGSPFDPTRPPVHGTGSMDRGEKTGKEAGDRLYLSLQDEVWSKGSRYTGKGFQVPATEENSAKYPNAVPYFDYKTQGWMLDEGSHESIDLVPVHYRVRPDAKVLVIDSPEALQKAQLIAGRHWSSPTFYDDLQKGGYDVVEIRNAQKIGDDERNGNYKFFRGAMGDQAIVLNPDVASLAPTPKAQSEPPKVKAEGNHGDVEQNPRSAVETHAPERKLETVSSDGNRDESAGTVTDGSGRTGPLETAPSEDGEGARAKRPAKASRPRRPREDAGRDTGPDAQAGNDVQRSVGADEGEVPVSSGRGDSPETGRTPRKLDKPKSDRDFRLTPEHLADLGGKVGRFRQNLDAIRTLRQVLAEDREATQEEKEKLARYVGWGALSEEAFGYSYEKSIRELQQNLRELLTTEEYEAARASTKNAHYTTPEVIAGMWQAAERLGVRPGSRVLEPSAGVGHFFGMQPEHMLPAWRSAAELDPITGNIAKLLYPDANVIVGPYQKAPFPDNYFDVAIGNVPFGKIAVADPAFNRNPEVRNGIHNYFFAKALNQVKPGGLVAFVTSRYTMDRLDSGIRQYLAERAELVGAIRLPGGSKGAFAKNAGTQVTTDILFLRKRKRGEVPTESDTQWTKTVEVDAPKEDGTTGKVSLNEYYAKHPEMMLGEMKLIGGLRGDSEPALIGEFTPETMAAAVERLPKGALDPTSDARTFTEQNPIALTQDDMGVKDGGFKFKDGALYRREGNELKPVKVTAAVQKRIAGMIGVRDALREVYSSQYHDKPDAEVNAAQKQLGKLYDAFVKAHGPVTAKENERAFETDPDYPVIAALEGIDKKTGQLVKSAVFTERTIEPYRPVTKVDSAQDALGVVLAERGRLDLDRMEQLTGKTRDELVEDLGDAVFESPSGDDVLPADEYLSGNVRKKLAEAREAAKHESKYQKNVEALEKVQPRDLVAHQIAVRFGANWVPLEDYKAFLVQELFGSDRFGSQWLHLEYSPVSATYTIHVSDEGRENGTNKNYDKHFYGDQLAEMALNGKRPKVYDRFDDGSSQLNATKTLASEEKQNRLMASFDKWLFADPQRADRLTTHYNQNHNAIRLREFDGTHLKFPGMNKAILRGNDLDGHQKNAVWRVISSGNTLLAHAVGAGKTYEMIAAGMEMKRMGLIRKPMYVVPNHMVEQFGADVLKLYPHANVFIAGKDTFGKGKRQLTASRIAAGNFDAIVLAHKSFETLPISDATFNRFVQQEMKEINEELKRLQAAEGRGNGKKKKKGNTVKALETRKENLQAQLEKRAKREKKDNAVDFENLGVDQLFVDEAHMYKNLGYTSAMERIAGLPNTNSNRAFDMFVKSRWLNERNDGRGVVFATGTPVANTMAELYTMMRYLALPYLEEHGIAKFDSWAAMFGRAARSVEVAPEGGKFRTNTRFVEFVNVPELITGFRTVADVKMADQLNLPKPTLKTGRPIVVQVPSHPLLKAFVRLLGARAQDIRGGKVDPSEDNMLKITHEGRMAALDIRLFQSAARDAVGTVQAMIASTEREIAHLKSATYTDAKEQRKAAGNIRLKEKDLAELRTVYAEALPYVQNPSLLNQDAGNLKLHKVAENIARIWQETADKRSTQVVFLDLSTPKAEKEKDVEEDKPAVDDDAPEGMAASAYAELKQLLIKRGVPADEIRFIHEAKDDAQKLELFKAVRSGKIRVVLGSTEKMGAGTNMQDKMIALHHVDVPWRPADIEQRNGRIERQGNENAEVEIYNYVTQGSFDAYMWQGIATKAKMISAAMSGDLTARTISDTSTQVLSAKETLALASGDPLVQERIETESKVAELQRSYNTHMELEAEHTRTVGRLQREIAKAESDAELYQKAIAEKKDWLAERRAAIKKAKPDLADEKVAEAADKQLLAMPGIKEPKGEDLKDLVAPMAKGDDDVQLGTYGPFKLIGSSNWFGNKVEIDGAGWSTSVDKNSTGSGIMQSLRSWWMSVESGLPMAEARLKKAEQELQVRSGRKPGEFEKLPELEAAQARLEELNKEFGLYDDEGAPEAEGETPAAAEPGVVSRLISDESGAFNPAPLIQAFKDAKDSDLVKAALDFMRPTGSRIAELGKAGGKLHELLVKARDTGEMNAGLKIARLVYDTGIRTLTKDQRFNLVDALEGRAKPTAKVLPVMKEVRKLLDELAAEAIRLKVKVTRKDPATGQRVRVPFTRRSNYFPHRIPNVDQLKRGQIREDVIAGMVRRKVSADAQEAGKFLDSYVRYVETGKRQSADRLIKWLIRTGQAQTPNEAFKLLEAMRKNLIRRNRSLEYSREVNLPFWDPDALRVLPGAITGQAKRLAQIEHFGQDHGKITALRRGIRSKEGQEASDFVTEAVKEVLGTANHDAQLERFFAKLRSANAWKLGLAFIPNTAQGFLNSWFKSDIHSAAAGLRAAFTEDGKRFATESGASLDSVLHEAMRNTGQDGRALGIFLRLFTATERANRIVAANSGATWARREFNRLRLNPKNESARDHLAELGIDVAAALKRGSLTPQEILLAGNKFSGVTQFRGDVLENPLWTASPIGKLIYQFKQYAYGQSRLVANTLQQEWRNNKARMIRRLLILAMVFPMAGAVVDAIREILKTGGLDKHKKLVARFLHGFIGASTLGMVSDLFEAGSIRKTANTMVGPTLSSLADLVEAAAADTSTVNKRLHGKRTAHNPGYALAKWLTRQGPFGSLLAPWIFPPKAHHGTRSGRSESERLAG